MFRTDMNHAYPQDLATFVSERWRGASGALPELEVLERLVSACYQASQLREEERTIIFRVILCDPERLSSGEGPPGGLHPLEFPEPRPFDVQELRRLSPAASYYRSLIGVCVDEEHGLRIWGLVHSGPRWLRFDQGGRDAPPPLPPALILRVFGPGRITVDCGYETVGKLDAGELSDTTMNVFDSRWLPNTFAPVRSELAEIHSEARTEAERAGESWFPLDNDITRVIGQHTIKRIIAAVRNSRHGGTLVIVPPDLADAILEDRYVALKYKFADDEPRRRFRTLIVSVMNTLARSYGRDGHAPGGKAVGWGTYEVSSDEKLSDLDEAIFEVAHLIAGLCSVDGAVVMTQRFELLGFGGEISGMLPELKVVGKALDIEGDEVVEEPTEGFGTRHRSAYRLCNELRDAIAVVVSQDSNVRFVKYKDGAVTYWDQG